MVAHLLCKQGVRGSSPLGSTRALLALLLATALVACGGDDGESADSGTGVTGRVLLGPTCPVEVVGEECEDTPAAEIEVTAYQPSDADPMTPGREVAAATTDAGGEFRIDLEPGPYLVTAVAGMSCDVVPVTVTEGEYAAVDVPCDTGIR